MGELVGERVGEEGEALIFGLNLAAVGERVAMGVDGAIGEQRAVGAIVGQRGGCTERQSEFAGEAGIAGSPGALGGDFAAEVGEDDLERGIGEFGRIDERDAAVAVERTAELRAEERLSLGEQDLGADGLNVERREGEFATGAELVVRAAGDQHEQCRGEDETGKSELNHGFHG